jgi:enoyl-CoA hydratase/carnithine racemase
MVESTSLGIGDATAAIVILNRPATLNAISWEMVKELEVVLARLDGDSSTRVILITGAGRAFSAGGDLIAYLELQQDPVGFPQFMKDLIRTFSAIRSMEKPVVALVNGVAVAGGLELLLACDFAYAAESARVGDGHVNYAQAGGGGSLALLPRAIGPAKARELVMSGVLLDAHEAAEWGLVNRVFPDDQLREAGLEFARLIASKSAAAVSTLKVTMNECLADGTGVDAALRLEQSRIAQYCLTLPDSRAGLLAFARKATPQTDNRAAQPAAGD